MTKSFSVVSDAIGLLLKLVALIAAAAVIFYAVLPPRITWTPYQQAFIDLTTLNSSLRSLPGADADDVAVAVAHAYNSANQLDLENGKNDSRAKTMPIVHELCDKHRKFVTEVVNSVRCSGASPRIGRGRDYEADLLLRFVRAHREREVSVAQDDLQALRDAEYLKASVTVKNDGINPGIDVRITSTGGFTPISGAENPIPSLARGDSPSRYFVSAIGVDRRTEISFKPNSPAEDPDLQFDVSWKRDSGPLPARILGPVVAIALGLFGAIVLVAILVWFVRRRPRASTASSQHLTFTHVTEEGITCRITVEALPDEKSRASAS